MSYTIHLEDEFGWWYGEPQDKIKWSYLQAAMNAERHDCSDSDWDLINRIYTLTEASVTQELD